MRRARSAAAIAAGLLLTAALAAGGAPKPAAPVAREAPLPRLEAPARRGDFIESIGERSGIWGPIEGPLEGWVWPFELFDGLSLAASSDGGRSFVPAGDLLERHVALPHLARVRLGREGLAITATLFAPRGTPGLVVLLDVRSERETILRARFRPVLAPMHLATKAPPGVTRNPTRSELVAREPGRAVELRVRAVGGAMELEPAGRQGMVSLRLSTPPVPRSPHRIALLFGVSWPRGPTAAATLDRLETGLPAALERSAAWWRARLRRVPKVTSADPAIARALAWSAISLERLRIRNPDLGLGIVSGFSPSRGTTRPKYAWFFEEPMLTARALWRLGLEEHVRGALRFLLRWQRPDGKTPHEVTQSLRWWPRYFEEYRWAYLHSDGPVYYLAAWSGHWRATGDLAFARELWPAMRKTLQWCFRACDPSDGLIRTEPGDWGSSESSRAVAKDSQLEAMWLFSLRGAGELARAIAEEEIAAECEDRARRVSEAIEEKLWNESAGAYRWGIDRAGRPLDSLVPHYAIGIWSGSFRPERARRSLEAMAGADFRSDWGVRSLSLADPRARAGSYQSGSVWPVWNAGVIVSDFLHGRPEEGYRNWRAMLALRELGQLGPMPEVLDGLRYRKLPEAVPHQQFSEIAPVCGFFDGLLGLQVDAPRRRARIAPWLPPDLDRLAVEGIPVGRGERIDLRLGRERESDGAERLSVVVRAPPGSRLALEIAPRLAAGSRVARAMLDGEPVDLHAEREPWWTTARLGPIAARGEHRLRIEQRDGVAWLPVDAELEPGRESLALRIIRSRLDGSRWSLLVEGRPGRRYPVRLWSTRHPVSIDGGRFAPTSRPDHAAILLQAPPNAPPSPWGYTRWKAEVRFDH